MISRMRGSSCCKTSIWVHRRHAHGRLPRGTCWKSGEMLERRDGRWARLPHADRSEEHTSELQSPCNLVCRLLLEKKKTRITLSPLPPMHLATGSPPLEHQIIFTR